MSSKGRGDKSPKPAPSGTPVQGASSRIELSIYSGLPSPEALERYNARIKDGAERIFKMAEVYHEHRMELEKDVVHTRCSEARADGRRVTLGILLTFIARVGAVAGGAYIIVNHGEGAGLAFGYCLAGMGALSVLFGKRK